MLPNYAGLEWPRSLSKGSDPDHFEGGVKMGKILRNVLEAINALSCQCVAGES